MNTAVISDLVEQSTQFNPITSKRTHFRYIDISSIDRQSKQITKPQLLTVAEAPSRARKEVYCGDVLVSTVRPNLNNVARVPAWLNREVASTGFCLLRAKKTILDGRYLFYFTQTDSFVSHLVELSTGAGYPAVSDNDIFNTHIPLPPLPEQQRIAAILEKADHLRRRRQYAQQMSDTFLQSVFLEMFGDPASNMKCYDIVPFEEVIASTKLGLVRGSADMDENYPYSYVRMDAITGGGMLNLFGLKRVEATKKEVGEYSLHTGDFLFNTRNSKELVGKTALFTGTGRYLFNNNIMRVRFNSNVLPEYMMGLFQTLWARHNLELIKSGTTSVFAIYYKDLRELPILLPPLALQEKFASVVQRVERLRAQQREATRQAEYLFQSLLKEAFADKE